MGELALPRGDLVRAEAANRIAGVVQRRHARLEHLPGRPLQPVDHLRDSRLRHKVAHQVARPLVQQSRGVAVGVPVDPAAHRVRRGPGDAGHLQRAAVGVAQVPGYVGDVHRIVGRGGVHVLPGDVPHVLDERVVETATRYPLAPARLLGGLAELLHDVGDGAVRRSAAVHHLQVKVRRHHRVDVGLDEPRHNRLAIHIEHGHRIDGHAHRLFVRAHSHDPPAQYRHGLGARATVVERYDVGVSDYQVHRLSSRAGLLHPCR